GVTWPLSPLAGRFRFTHCCKVPSDAITHEGLDRGAPARASVPVTACKCFAAAGQLLRPGFINHDRTIVILLGARKSSHGGPHGYCSPWWQLTDATMLDFRVDWEEQ